MKTETQLNLKQALVTVSFSLLYQLLVWVHLGNSPLERSMYILPICFILFLGYAFISNFTRNTSGLNFFMLTLREAVLSFFVAILSGWIITLLKTETVYLEKNFSLFYLVFATIIKTLAKKERLLPLLKICAPIFVAGILLFQINITYLQQLAFILTFGSGSITIGSFLYFEMSKLSA